MTAILPGMSGSPASFSPTEVTPMTRGPIVLGTEFGPVSAAAERVAIRHARREGVPLVIVHAIDPGRLRGPAGIFRQRIDQVRASREAAARALVERVRSAGVEAQLLIWDGDPATCVLEAARAEGASRIVVGSHGRGRIGRAIAGSVSTELRERAACPVEVVRDGWDDDLLATPPS
jgi:nucleotide-binding universal stress UspA family protein